MIAAAKKLKRALTIEYVIILMVIVTAFVAVILTSATVFTGYSVDYQNYSESKRFLDEIGTAYIEGQGASGCLDEYSDNEYNYNFEYTSTYLLVRWGTEKSTVELHIELADTDGDGVKEAVSYVYGP